MSAGLLAQLRWAGLTHAGHARRTNEDALAMIPARGVFVRLRRRDNINAPPRARPAASPKT